MIKLVLTILVILFLFEKAHSLECYSCENCEKAVPLREVCKNDEKFCSVSIKENFFEYEIILKLFFLKLKKTETKTSSLQIQTTKACVSKCSQSSGVAVAGVELSVFCCVSNLCNNSISLKISISLFISIITFLFI